MNKATITIVKSYTNQDGSIAGMFRVDADKATKTIRHALVDLEGMECEVKQAGLSDDQKAEPINGPCYDTLKSIEHGLEIILESVRGEIKDHLAPLHDELKDRYGVDNQQNDLEKVFEDNGCKATFKECHAKGLYPNYLACPTCKNNPASESVEDKKICGECFHYQDQKCMVTGEGWHTGGSYMACKDGFKPRLSLDAALVSDSEREELVGDTACSLCEHEDPHAVLCEYAKTQGDHKGLCPNWTAKEPSNG